MSEQYHYNNPMKYSYYPKALKSPNNIARPDVNTLIKNHKDKKNVGAVRIKPKNIDIEDQIKDKLEKPSNVIYNYTLYGGIASIGMVAIYTTSKIISLIAKTSK